MIGLMQSASAFVLGALVVILGGWVAKDLFRVAGILIATVGLAIAGLSVAALLADYPLWQAALAVFFTGAIGYTVVAALVAKVPFFQLHPDSEE